MNQYPGFVPMMVPQPFMVAMPGMPLQGIQPPHPGIPQMMSPTMPTVAVAHARGVSPISTQAAIAQGMPLTARQGTPLGMTAAALQGLPDQRQFVDPSAAAAAGMQGFPGMGMQSLMQQEAVEVPPENPQDDMTFLDEFNSDLNLVIDSDGYGAHTLNQPSGFCFTWAGVRASHGICKGKGFYEIHITEHLPVDFGDDHNETDPHIIRVGWSIDSSPFQLGEEPWSYGYGGTGKFSTNNKFTTYGEKFEAGDVIGALLDLDERPATISYMKNGKWLGVAQPLHAYPVGNRDMALYPHILSKNCRFKVNFGQIDPWFPPPMLYPYIGVVPERVRGMKEPEKISDCEMIMIVGLPGAGKTTWGINMYKNHPEKRYNIIGTDTLIEKMRVMGLPRKRNYHGRWDALISKASQCLNKLFTIAGKRKRNYILDQTNVYPSARRKKMRNFNGFYKIAAVIQPDDPELLRRSHKRTVEDGKVVPEEAVLEMKANFTLPEDRDNLFDRIDFVELPRDHCTSLLLEYNQEGQQKRPPRELVFKDNKYNQNYRGRNQPQGQGRFYPDHNQGYDAQDRSRSGYQHERGEPPNKRIKPDAGSALDFLKQYGAGEEEPSAQQAAKQGGWGDKAIKEEPSWNQSQYGWPQQPQNAGSRGSGGRDQQQQNYNQGGQYWDGQQGGGTDSSQSWQNYGEKSWQNQEDKKPWQQGSADSSQYGGQDNSRFDSSRGYGNRQDSQEGYGGQSSGYGGQGGYGGNQGYSGNQGEQQSGNFESKQKQYGDDSRQQNSRNYGQKDFSDYGRQESRGYDQGSRKYGESRNDSSYDRKDRQYGQSNTGSYDNRSSYGRGGSEGNQDRSGGYDSASSYGGQSSSDNFRSQQSNNPSFDKGSSYSRDSDRGGSYKNFGAPPPPPPPQDSVSDSYGESRSYQQQDYSASKSADPKPDDSSLAGPRTERVRRRKSKWDTPVEPVNPPEIPASIELAILQATAAEVKTEPVSDLDQYSDKAENQLNSVSSANNSQNQFGRMNFNQPPPSNSWKNSQNDQDQFSNQHSNFERGRPPMRGNDAPNQFGSDNQFGDAQKRGSPFDNGGGHGPGPGFHGKQGPGPNGNPGPGLLGTPGPGPNGPRPNMRPPFEPRHPHGGPRFPPGNRGPRRNFGPGGPGGPGGPMPFRPRNPQNFGGPPGGPPGGGPPGGWNQNRPRFGPRGPRPPFNPRFGPDGGQRFPRPPGQQRFSRP